MSFFFAYLIKFSISLAAVYLFYRFVLRKLTFYNWNRWYLVGYTLLSFFIAAINITPLLQRNELADNRTIQWVPALDLYTNSKAGELLVHPSSASWNAWDWTLFILAAGTIILLIRLIIQYLSFLRIRSKAQLLSQEGMNLYQVDGDIIPFSFGNSIFINKHLHTEEELQEIIHHEFVHVRQRHSVDILWSEFLCIINWYNPFAWLLRLAMRQNLEFIADNKVISNGVDRKQYQYLLLKVIGNKHFSIAPKFNFSSLKKRIAMMNKLKSAKVHLFKFLFLLPVAIVMLLAFRNKDNVSGSTRKWVALTDTIPSKIKLPDAIEGIGTVQKEGADPSDPINKKVGGMVLVKRKDGGKEVYDLNSDKSLADFKKKYGVSLEDILPPPPPEPPSPPTPPTPPTDPVAPVAPVAPTPKATGSNESLSRISSEYEITDKKAFLKLKDGTIEEYDLQNEKERAAFENKYGKIIHVNTNVNADVNANLNSNINTNVKAVVAAHVNSNINTNINSNTNTDINSVITIPTPIASVKNNLITAVAPAAISRNGISTASVTPAPTSLAVAAIDPYSYMITGDEDIIVTITKNTTRQELDKFIADMKAKGVELKFDEIEYNDKGKLVNINGTMKSGDSRSNFVANGFEKLILAMIKQGDRVWFKVSVKDKEVI